MPDKHRIRGQVSQLFISQQDHVLGLGQLVHGQLGDPLRLLHDVLGRHGFLELHCKA